MVVLKMYNKAHRYITETDIFKKDQCFTERVKITKEGRDQSCQREKGEILTI